MNTGESLNIFKHANQPRIHHCCLRNKNAMASQQRLTLLFGENLLLSLQLWSSLYDRVEKCYLKTEKLKSNFTKQNICFLCILYSCANTHVCSYAQA